ncbi:hypothetical protein FEE95_15015 [Maribacter algarum]|uniref:Lipoprotein n=1 Tax=Maribacter algarum (ex Zhang et al. 2020) TaxID=2578118 RepID=A0A5S3PNF5_9FLAO|nr:hypothetical protein [Maribacter algarum]TMM55953.1 hypothetical protein FEE95_15015 [Maribacter algarum]
MRKIRILFFTALSVFLLSSCVKAAKDLVDDIELRTQCVERLAEYTTESGDKTCSQIRSEIDAILRDCGEFLSQEEKDDLNFAKDNCTDN